MHKYAGYCILMHDAGGRPADSWITDVRPPDRDAPGIPIGGTPDECPVVARDPARDPLRLRRGVDPGAAGRGDRALRRSATPAWPGPSRRRPSRASAGRRRTATLFTMAEKDLCRHVCRRGSSTSTRRPASIRTCPLAALGPWIVTSHGAVLHDSGGYGMLGLGHAPDAVVAAIGAAAADGERDDAVVQPVRASPSG